MEVFSLPETFLTRQVKLVASHFFAGTEMGDLNQEHHHVYTIAITVKSNEKTPLDLGLLDNLIQQEVISPMERHCLNQLDPSLKAFPSTEAIATFLSKTMFEKLGNNLARVRVEESPDLFSEVVF